MYFYLYDSFLGGEKYEKEMSEIENYLTDLDIAGVIERVSIFKTIKDILKSAVKKGAKTIVVVGNDHTFREAIKFIPDFGITFGFIPIGQPNFIAHFLGLPFGAESCDALSARMIEKIDVGKITMGGQKSERMEERKNEAGMTAASKYFLGSVIIPKTKIKLNCDNKYALVLKETGDIAIFNTPFSEEAIEFSGRDGNELLDPRDEKLDLFISVYPSSFFARAKRWFKSDKTALNQSHLTVKSIKIDLEDKINIFVDKTEIEGKNFEIGLAEEKIKLIIGKNRLF